MVGHAAISQAGLETVVSGMLMESIPASKQGLQRLTSGPGSLDHSGRATSECQDFKQPLKYLVGLISDPHSPSG